MELPNVCGIELLEGEMKRYGTETKERFFLKLSNSFCSWVMPQKAELSPFCFDKMPQDCIDVVMAYHRSSGKTGVEVPIWKIVLSLYFHTNEFRPVATEDISRTSFYSRTYCINCYDIYGIRGYLDTSTNVFYVRDIYQWDTKNVPFE